ncbi:hypothetical protein B0T16DRAFT_413384 [Cercophora newfieldiana]|uniref:Pentatricopeptide repeat-containing protein n=1 Tax=Cercophora newfieldiana TaxID=92897 RepID=A0AA40CPM4_9PEZI|nr:hypothetical protein B0T16DRAFT_413384 [Cercophora newfieldiana]
MKELGYVCLRCRVRLLTGALARPGFQPTRSPNYRQNYSTANIGEPQAQNRGQRRNGTANSAAPTIPREGGRRAQRSATRPDGASSLALFQSIIGKKNDTLAPATTQSQTSNIALVKDVAELQTMLDRKNASVADAYAFFDKTILPQLRDTDAGGSALQIVKKQLATVLFPKVAHEMSTTFPSTKLPTVTRITQLMVEFGVVGRGTWANLVIALVDYICRLRSAPGDYTSIQAYETSMAQRDALLHDLLGAWKAFGTPTPNAPESAEAKHTETPITEATDASPPLPSADSAHPREDQKSQRKPYLANAFAELFPRFLSSSLVGPSNAALATYALLAHLKNHNQAIWHKAHPFLEMMRQLLANCSVHTLPNPRAPVFEGCPKVLDSLLKHFLKGLRNKEDTEWRPISIPTEKSLSFADRMHKEVGRAIRTRSMAALDAAWETFWGKEDVLDAARLEQLREMGEMFNYFIFAYMSMRQTQSSLNIWNSMVKHGIEPTVKTWTSMIKGCTNARNPEGIETIWKRLVTSGTKLDAHAWTARISGLIMSGDLKAGLGALNEMAQIWRERDKPEYTNIAVKPSVEPINAAVVWLLRLDRLPVVKEVLLWAAKQGIEPDIYTFNTMLRPMVREGRTAEVRDVLDMMKTLNVNADAATFTILLEGAMAGVGSLTPKEQVERVNYIVGEIEAAGFKANMQAYGKMIYILLEEGGPNSDGAAVNAVLSHIWSRGLELSPHIYTMLAEHYFSRDPPDIKAVNALIKLRMLRENRNVDRVFWERVIKGYCQAGETQRALEIFQNSFASGSVITFSTMHELLLALLEAGHVEGAKGLVDAARGLTVAEGRAEEDYVEERHVQGTGTARTARYWKHRFWHLAEQQGLMPEEVRETFRVMAQSRGRDWE